MNQLNFIANSIPEFMNVVQKIQTNGNICYCKAYQGSRYILVPNLQKNFNAIYQFYIGLVFGESYNTEENNA